MFQRNIKLLKNEKGYTLVEILVVIFLLGLILAPTFNLMGKSYAIASEENEMQSKRENFRIITIFMMEDLMHAKSVNIENYPTYDTLSYTTVDGKSSTIIFDEQLGMFLKQGSERVHLTEGERFEPSVPMVRMDNERVIRFNFYAREVNSLVLTNIKPRPDGGI